MTLFSTTFKAEAVKTNPEIFPVLEITFPDSARRYASAGVSSITQGHYQAKVVKGGWGSISRGALDRTGRLEAIETSVTIDDSDFEFAMLLESRYAYSIRRSAASIKLVSPNVTYANSFSVFTGMLSSWEFLSNRTVKLILRINDLPLQRSAPKVPIAQDFVNSTAEVLGQFVPLIYGTHDATGLGATGGAVPALYVDTVGFRYLLSQGWLKDVTRVWADGSAASGYSITHPTINGRLYTLIDFTADQGDAVITADVSGFEVTGDGSGALISEPVDQLRHFLENFVFGDYHGGNWTTGNAPLNTTHWDTASAFMDSLSVTGSRRFSGAQVIGVDIVNEICNQLNLKAFWTNAGQLAILPQDFRTTTVYSDDPWIRQDAGYEISGWGIKDDPTGIVDRVMVRHCFLEDVSDFSQSLELRDTESDEEAAESLDYRFSPSSIV